jgi:hypothetical protein
LLTAKIHIKNHWKLVIWASWVILLALYVRIFSYIVFGEIFVSLSNDIVEIAFIGIIGFISMLFIQYGGLEYDRMTREIERDKSHDKSQPEFRGSQLEMKKHWKIIVIGSIIALFTVIARALFYFFTGSFPTIIGDEVVEIATFAIIISVFLWFIHIGIVEYSDIRYPSERKASDKEM